MALQAVPPARYPEPAALHLVALFPSQAGWSGAQTPDLQVALVVSQYLPASHAISSCDESPLASQTRTLLPEQKLVLGVHSWSSQAPAKQLCFAAQAFSGKKAEPSPLQLMSVLSRQVRRFAVQTLTGPSPPSPPAPPLASPPAAAPPSSRPACPAAGRPLAPPELAPPVLLGAAPLHTPSTQE